MFRFNLVNYIYLTLLKIKPVRQSIHCITLRTLDIPDEKTAKMPRFRIQFRIIPFLPPALFWLLAKQTTSRTFVLFNILCAAPTLARRMPVI